MKFLFVTLLLTTLLFANVQCQSCTALNKITKFRIQPDGLDGQVFTDSSWTKNFCELTGERRVVDYDSGEQVLQEGFTQTFLPKTLKVNKITIRRKAIGVLERTKMNLNITIEITTFISGTISNVPVLNLQVRYKFEKKLQDFLYISSDTSLIRWIGSVTSDSGSQIRVIDLDLFDRQEPVFFNLKQQNSKLHLTETMANQRLRDVMIDSLSFIDSTKISPTSLHAPSIRNIFLKNITKTEEKMEETFGRIWLPNSNQFSDEGVYAQKHHVCSDPTKCGKLLVHALLDIIKETVGSKCDKVEIIPGTFHASNVLEVFVGSQKSNMKNIQADTTASFQCDNNGFISAHILFTSFSNEWWINRLSTSAKTIKAIIKSMKSNIHGEIFGTIQKDNKIYTSIRNSLFSDVPGGVFVQDSKLSKNTLLDMFTNVRLQLETGIKLHDDFKNSFLSDKKVEGIYNAYMLENQVPTVFGFLHKVSEVIGFKLIINQDQSVYMYFTLKHFSTTKVPIDDISIEKINSNLEKFEVKIERLDQMNETEFNSISTMGFKVSQILDSNKTVETIDPLRMASTLIIKSDELQLTATYDYQSRLANVICKGKALDTEMEIAESVKLNTTSVAVSLENIVRKLDDTLLVQNLPVFGTEFSFIKEDTSIEDSFSNLLKEIQKEKFTEIVELKQKIENYFINSCGNVEECGSVISILAIPLANNLGLRFGLTYKRLVSMKLSSDDGTIFSYSPRISLRILSNVLLSGDLQNDVANNFKYIVNSKTKSFGYAIPFRFNMTSSLTKSSQIDIDINFPTTAKIDMSFDISNEYYENMQATIKSVAPLKDRLNVIVKLTGAEPELFLSPFEVLDGITQKIFRFTDWYWFNITLPLMQHPMDLTNTWIKDSTSFSEWASSPKRDDKNLLFYIEIANDVVSIPQLNITLNDMLFQCSIDKIERQSVKTMVDNVNNGLKQCNLDSIFNAELPPNVDDLEPSSDISIPIYPSTGKTNYIWDIKGQSKPIPSTQNLGFGSRLNVFPVFTTWRELSWMMNAMFGIEFSGPTGVTISQRELGIPEYLSQIYPQNYYTNSFPLHFEAFHFIDNILLTNELKNTNFTNATFHLNLMNQTTENLNVKTILDFHLSSVDVSGLNNITVFTNVDGENTTLNSIIKENQNSFIVKIRVHEKKKLTTTPIIFNKQMNLPVGMKFQDAFIGWLPSQFPPEIQPMLNISLFDVSTLFDENVQVQIQLHRHRIEDDWYLLPISLEISDSNLPGLNVSSNTPTTEIVVLSKSNFTVNSNFEYKGRIQSGSFGVLNIKTKDSKVQGSGNAQFSCLQKSNFMDIRRFAPLKTESMSEDFSINIITDAILKYPNFALDMSEQYPALTALNFKWLNNWRITNRDDYIQSPNEIQNMNIVLESEEPTIVDTYKMLSQFESNNLCTVLESFLERLREIANNKIMKSTIPFISQNFEKIFENNIERRFKLAQEQVCQERYELSLAKFCEIISSHFDRQICHDQVAGDKKFEVTLKVDALSYSFGDSMNIHKNLINAKTMPPLVSVENSLVISSLTSLEIRLKANWENNRFNFDIVDGATITQTISSKLQGSLKAFLGPLSLGLAQAHIRLGEPEPLTLKVTLNRNQPPSFSVTGNADFSSSIHIFDKEICKIGINVPNVFKYLQDGSGVELDQRTCQGSFEDALKKVFDEHSFFGFFRDPGVFVQQWRASIGNLLKNWKSMSFFGRLLSVSAPLVKFAIPKLFEEGVKGLAGNDITNQFANQIQDIRDTIGGSEMTNRTSMEQRALELFTEVLYSVLPLRQKPKTPNVKDPKYVWKLMMEKGISKPIAELDFELGSRSWARFEAKCKPKLELLFRMNVSLVYEKNEGVYFHFDDELIFTSRFALPLKDCSLSGTLGILGADLKVKDTTAFGASLDLAHARGTWTPHYKLKSHLSVGAIVGIAGDVLKMRASTPGNPLEQFLHFKMDIEFIFEHDFNSRPRPILRFSDIQMCIGNFLTKLVGRFREEAGRILDPLERIAGPNSFLMKKIPPTRFIYGRELTLGEYAIILASRDCEGVCEAVNVREILETYRFLTKILALYSKLKPFLSGSGCGVIKRGNSFQVDMNRPNDIKVMGAEVADEIEIQDPKLNPVRGDIMGIWKDLTGKHGFNIEFNLTPQNIPKLIVSVLLGIDIDILSISFPPVRLGVSAYFPITIYCCPPKVDLFFGVAIGLKIQIPKMILSTTGMAEAVRTRKIQHLGLGVKLQTRNNDGTPIPIVQGSFKITAGVSISVFIFNGRAWFYLELVANFYILDVNGSPYVTFDQVMNLPRHASFEIILQCGFGFDIRVCIRILWKRKCWTLIRKNFGPYRLASWKIGGASIPKSADHRGVNLDKSTQGAENVYTFTEDYVSFAENAGSIPLASTKLGNQINYFGNAGSKPIVYNIEDYTGLVNVPPSNNIQVNFDVSRFPTIETIMISTTGITPNTGSSGLNIRTCNKVNIKNPLYNNVFLLNGIPCDFNIDIKDSTIQLNGQISSYQGKNLMLKESGDLIVNVPGSVYYIESGKLLINDKQLFETSDSLNSIEINAKDNDNVFQIKSTHDDTDVTINGAQGIDTFIIHNIWDIGKLVVNGIAGINDKIQTTLQIPKQGAMLRIFGTMLTAIDGNNLKKTIVTNNVPNKDIVIESGENTRTQVSIMPLDVHDHVKISTRNRPNSIININVTNCESRQNIRHFLSGGGSQTVFIGDGGTISHLKCNIDIVGDDENEYMIVIDAKKDKRRLQYWMNSGIDHSRLRIFDPVNTDFALVIATTNIKRVIVHFSNEETTQFITIGTPKFTEYQLYYPNRFLPNKQLAHICSTNEGANFAIFGVVDISLGPKSFVCEQQSLQLTNIQSEIAILGGLNTNDKSIIRLNSPGSKPHYSKVNDICYIPTDKEGNSIVQLHPLTQWLKNSLASYGEVSRVLCFVVYTPNTSSMHLTTGSGDDIVLAENVKFSSFDAHLGDGFNTLSYGKSLTPGNFSSGNTGCRFTQESPSDRILLKLEAPGKNILDFYVKDFPASFTERGIGPIGPNRETAYASFTVHKYDQVTMHSGKN